MSSPIDTIVDVNITQGTQAVQQASFSIPLIMGPTNRFAGTPTTGTTVSGSPTLSVIAVYADVGVGQMVTGVGIPTDTTILSIVGATATMSKNATASASGVAITFSDLIRPYTSLAGMLGDGYLTTDQEYIRAKELLQQELQPDIFYVGFYGTAVAQVITVTPDVTLQSAALYTATINGVAYPFTSDATPTATEIVTGIKNLITADANAVVVATGTTTLILTAINAGVAVTVTLTANLTQAATTANSSIVTYLQNAQASPSGDLWYGLLICSQNTYDILEVASYIETQLKLFGADTNQSAILTSSTTDIASQLKALGYKRTFLIYSPTANDGSAAAWMGGQLPQIPGASTWKFKTLKGIVASNLTESQRTRMIGTPEVTGKNVNIYETVGGVGITQEGMMVGGQFIDVTVGIDWLVSRMQENVYSKLINSPKIPYTDAGVAVIENGVRETLQQGVANGLIDGKSPIIVTAPLVLDVPTADRAIRNLPGVTFSCRLSGAIHFVTITGVVSV